MTVELEPYEIIAVDVWNTMTCWTDTTLFHTLKDFVVSVRENKQCFPIVADPYWAELNNEVCQLSRIMAEQIHQTFHTTKEELLPFTKSVEFTQEGIPVELVIEIDYRTVYKRKRM